MRMSPFFHTKKGAAMRASVAVRIRKDRVNKSGLAPVILQVIINSKRLTIPLKVSWPVDRFDNTAGIFLERKKGDGEASDYNLLAAKEVAKINEIFIYYRHSDFELSTAQFNKEYSRFGAKRDFLAWAKLEVEDRYMANRIELQTKKNSLSCLRKIEGWQKEVKFSDLDGEWMANLQAYLKNKVGMKINTVHGILKTVKVYARIAHQQGIAVDMNAISSFKLPKGTGKLIYLTPEELTKLWNHYNLESIKPSHKQVLRQFLFSTLTGLRFSDIERVTWKEIEGDVLHFEPYKTRNIEKRVRVILLEEAFDLIENKKGKLFNTQKLQPTNRLLKDIARECNIRKNLSTHVARHTFATEFLRRKGQLHVLQKALGHSKIGTTMIYAHVDEAIMREQMMLMKPQIFCRS